MEKVYVAGAIPEVGLKLLQEHFEVEMYEGKGLVDKDTLIKGVKNATALISLLSTNVDKDVIDAGKDLKIIANYGAGFNNIDIEYAREKSIDVTNTPKASTNATADLTIGLVLAVARRARAFDMDVLYTGPNRKEEKEREIGAKYVDLDTLLKNADFITINAAYNPKMHHLIDTEQFKMMKSTVYLINASRGPIVHEQALVQALKDNEIEGAALDVYEFEPDITDDLKSLNNVVLTPHIGNATFEARDMMSKIVANAAISAVQGEKPQFVVN
ncbi:hydroxyacid dehydrogenase [Staphylococcus aureus]|nr:hydroxyacid dehydrogenase [Staphylococcus aureus]NGS39625.1 hydroxyacid dehydrogenase [Staphylococcus aureus]NGS59034.1 hydroxyacid dehydrogenase [Staphylococcus aureus]HCW9310157.1 hydroxyacid dehydrogenase [Staphylococcus aureus]